MPKALDISVVIPAFNCASYIGETIESVLNQTYSAAEIVIVDDGSQDDLEKALEPYMDRVVLVSRPNGGPAAARNTGVRHARYEYIQFVDSDDVLLPTALENQVECLMQSGADVVYGDSVFWGGCYNGKRFTSMYPSSGNVSAASLLDNTCNVMYAVLVKRQAILQAGMFDESLRLCGDTHLWLRMLNAGFQFAYHHHVLLRYRRHGEQGRTSLEARNLMWDGFTSPSGLLERVYWRLLLMQALPSDPETNRLLTLAASFEEASRKATRERLLPPELSARALGSIH